MLPELLPLVPVADEPDGLDELLLEFKLPEALLESVLEEAEDERF